MALKAQYEFLFVGRDDNSFLENYSYDLFKEYGDKSGQIFVNLEIQNNPVDAQEIGNAIFETMQTVFFEDVHRENYDRFEIALKAVNSMLGEFKAQKPSGYIGNLNIIVAAIADNTLFLTQSGDSEAYLIRKRYVSIISEGLSEETDEAGDIFSNIASGGIEPGDTVLFSTARLLRYISKTDLAKSLSKASVNAALEEVRDAISTEMLGRIGLTGMKFTAVSEEIAQEGVAAVGEGAETTLEGSNRQVSSERRSVAGKFFTKLKSYRKEKTKVYRGNDSGMFTGVIEWFKGLFKGSSSGGSSGKNKVLMVLVLLILLLIVFIFIAKQNVLEREEIKELDEKLTGVQEMILEADTKGEYDKESAREILEQAYEEAIEVLNSGYYREKAIIFLNDIEETTDKLDNVIRVESPTVFADLTEKRENVDALGFAEAGERKFVFEYNALYELVSNQVQDPLTIDDEETVVAATGFEDRGSVVFLTKSGKLIEYRDGTMSFMDSDDGTFRKGTKIEDWSNKIYVMDTTSSQIWKYSYKGSVGRFGTAEKYFAEDNDISGAVDFAIDSSVYVLFNNGDLNKFYGGSKAEFYINKPPLTVLKTPAAVYTSERLDEVYVLDSQESRVLVYDKDSQTGNVIYNRQYLLDSVGEIRDMYIEPDTDTLYVLTPTQVLEINITQAAPVVVDDEALAEETE